MRRTPRSPNASRTLLFCSSVALSLLLGTTACSKDGANQKDQTTSNAPGTETGTTEAAQSYNAWKLMPNQTDGTVSFTTTIEGEGGSFECSAKDDVLVVRLRTSTMEKSGLIHGSTICEDQEVELREIIEQEVVLDSVAKELDSMPS